MNKKLKIALGVIGAVVIVFVVLALLDFLSGGKMINRAMPYDVVGYDGALTQSASRSLGLSIGGERTESSKMMVEEEAVYDAMPTKAPEVLMTDNAASDHDEGGNEDVNRLIIKTGRFSIVVDDVNESVATIQNYAKEKGGFVVSSDISKSGLAPYATVVIRIPADIFDQGIGEIKALGEVKSERVDGQDVTEEYVDLEARMKNLRATEEQFLEIMKKAYKIEDILNVQRQLMYVREEIERLEGRMKYLRESAAMSTVIINLSTDPEELPVVDEADKWKPWSVVKNSARGLLEVGKGLANFIIWLVVYIPLWILIWVAVWLGMRFWKRHKGNQTKIN